MATNYKDIVENQKRLSQQMRDSQLQQAQTSFDQGQRSIREQLRQNRLTQQQNQGQLAEQSFLAQRANQQGAQSRGLGSSGLRDLGALQNQMQQGRATSELVAMDSQVQREAMQTKLGLSENLTNQMNQAESQFLQSQVEADRYGLDQQYRQSELMTTFMELAQSGQLSDAQLYTLAQVSGIDINQVMDMGMGEGPDGEGQTFGDILQSMKPWENQLYEKDSVDNKHTTAWTRLPEGYRQPIGTNDYVHRETGERLKREGQNSWRGEDGKVYNYYELGGKRELMTQDQAGVRINELFKGAPAIGTKDTDIQIVPQPNGKGWGFKYNGKIYTTYNKAKTKWDNKNKDK